MNDEFERRLSEFISKKGKNINASYTSSQLDMGGKEIWGNVFLEGNSVVIGYAMIFRTIENLLDNLYIHDLLTISRDRKNTIENIIKLNEDIAKEFGCKSLTIEGGDSDTKKIYEDNGYDFENDSWVGVKEI